MQAIEKFEVKGLFGSKDVALRIVDNAIVLVGPNGIGKSSVANIFYFFISRQWSRLLEYQFREITIQIGGEILVAKRTDISGLSDFRQLSTQLPLPTRLKRAFDRLINADLVEQFFGLSRITAKDREIYSSLMGLPAEEIEAFHSYVRRRVRDSEGDLFKLPRSNLDKRLGELVDCRILYLPTYRRIEKELKEVLPDFEERYRAHVSDSSSFRSGRIASHYVELVSFGMEDVKKRLTSKTQDLKDYSLSQHNQLSAIYLRDVIHGRADEFVARDRRRKDGAKKFVLAVAGAGAGTAVSHGDLRSWLRELRRLPLNRRIRGKYAIWFFETVLVQAAKSAKQRIPKGKHKVRVPSTLVEHRVVESLGGRIAMPTSLLEFLDRRIADPIAPA